ncbi:hypothetical protein AXG93_402s1240 [Marchantia polymorpha subsp. ruderalis]|uniref:Uncharacterized protein n=1 Tax=Marchantia polymorpha subsp. ruderalis TaxID=1480154 RepID=A0A176WDM3_MARPO|nr:hypothetical protein AXG93_402s1240 [Marchantia polymorpha subsp. ruderalis]
MLLIARCTRQRLHSLSIAATAAASPSSTTTAADRIATTIPTATAAPKAKTIVARRGLYNDPICARCSSRSIDDPARREQKPVPAPAPGGATTDVSHTNADWEKGLAHMRPFGRNSARALDRSLAWLGLWAS